VSNIIAENNKMQRPITYKNKILMLGRT